MALRLQTLLPLALLSWLLGACAAPDPALQALLPGEKDRFIRVCGTLRPNALGEYDVRRYELAPNWSYRYERRSRSVTCGRGSGRALYCGHSRGGQSGDVAERFRADLLAAYAALKPHMIVPVRGTEACQDGMVVGGKETYLNLPPVTPPEGREHAAHIRRIGQILGAELQVPGGMR